VLPAHCLDVLLRPGLLPPGFSQEQGAALWAQLFAASSTAERDALLKFVGYKSVLQVGGGRAGPVGWASGRAGPAGPAEQRAFRVHVRRWRPPAPPPARRCHLHTAAPQGNLLALLHQRRQLSGRKPEDRPPLEQRMQKLAAKVAACAPGDPSKAGEQLQKLLDARDNHVFSQLMLALAYGSSEEVRRRRPARLWGRPCLGACCLPGWRGGQCGGGPARRATRACT
jgi:hypothetical protein